MTTRRPGILLVNGPLPPPYGGIATYLAHALPRFASEGYEIHTIMDRRPLNPDVYDRFRSAGVRIHYGGGSKIAKGSRILRRLPLLMSMVRSWGLHPLDLFPVAQSIASWIDAAEEVLTNHSIEIIHAYDYPWVQGFVAAHLAHKYAKRYVQTTFGEIVPHREELVHRDKFGERYKPFVRSVLEKADAIVALSQHCASEIEYAGVSRSRVNVMYWGVDTKEYHPHLDGTPARERLRLGNAPIVLFVGQIRPRKGPQILLDAAPALTRKFPDAKVVFAGPDYNLVNQLKSKAAELGVAKNVVFAGAQSQVELLSLYAACDVFVFPTCTPIECLGLSMIQAMACGKPVVGSRINGIPEVTLDGKTGFLVEPGNSAGISQRVAELLGDSSLRNAMGSSARQRVEAVFDQDKLVSNLTRLYRSILGP